MRATRAARRRALAAGRAPARASGWRHAPDRRSRRSAALAARPRARTRPARAAAPFDRESQNNLGIMLRKVGRATDALAAHRRALALAADAGEEYAKAHNSLGSALRKLGRAHLEEAVAAHQRAIELEPDYADAHFNLARALVAKGAHARAALHFRRAHGLFAERLGPEHDDALDAIEQAEDAEAIAKATENAGPVRTPPARKVARRAASPPSCVARAFATRGRPRPDAAQVTAHDLARPRVRARVVLVACLELRHKRTDRAARDARMSRPPRGANRRGAWRRPRRRRPAWPRDAPAEAAAEERGRARVVELLGPDDGAARSSRAIAHAACDPFIGVAAIHASERRGGHEPPPGSPPGESAAASRAPHSATRGAPRQPHASRSRIVLERSAQAANESTLVPAPSPPMPAASPSAAASGAAAARRRRATSAPGTRV